MWSVFMRSGGGGNGGGNRGGNRGGNGGGNGVWMGVGYVWGGVGVGERVMVIAYIGVCGSGCV